MMKRFTTYLIFSILPFFVFAQNRTITGTVTSQSDSQPLPGVSVVVKGTTRGTVTDVDGKFSIELGPGDNTLEFSYIGHTAQSVTVDQRSEIILALSEDTKLLDEVVVIGYGTVRKSDLTGAVSSIKSSDLTKVPSVSPMQSLQGKVAGLQVMSSSGSPGSSPVVRIRGTGTFNNANPIYVVDGMILDNIDFLSSNDIESMEVLKDASATAIYGSRGANGVIMVTTKKGKIGKDNVTINVSGEYSIQSLQKDIDLLNGREFAIIANEIAPGSFNNIDAVPNTDWQDLLYRKAPMQNYQISATGSSAKMQYYFGLGYFKQDGIIPKSSYERVTLKLNNTYHVANNVRVGANLSFTPNKQQNTSGNAPFVVYRSQPVVTPYQPDGSYSEVKGVGNFLADIENTNSYDKAFRSVNNFFGEVDIAKGLMFRSSFGVDMAYRKNRNFRPIFYVSPQQNNSVTTLNKRNSDQLTWLWENTLSYNKEFGKHRIDVVAGYTMQEASSEFLELQGRNLIREGEDFWYFTTDNLNPTGVTNPNGVELDLNYSLTSYLFRANYSFDNRYLITGTFRRDGSSKFNKANRFGNFPSFGVGWNVINEPFMTEQQLFSNLKIRASWGVIGNEKIQYNRIYSRVENGLGGVFNEVLNAGATFGVSGNSDLVWESTNQTDVGVEFGFLNDQLSIEVDYYNKRTKDILVDLQVPGYLGNGDGASITYNAAEVLNRGFEYNIVWASETENGFRYRIGTVGTTIHNEAIQVKGTGGPGDVIYNSARTTATRPGLPLGAFYGYETDGIFQNASELAAYPHLSNAGVGDLRFVDTDGDGQLTPDDRTYIGSPIPSFLYGINFEVGYKGFDISADFQGQTGNEIYNAKETVRPDLYNFEQHVFDRWRGEGTSNSEPRAAQGGYNFEHSSRFIQDGSFFRLRSLTLGYNLPQTTISKAKLSSARIYVRGTNVFTLTKFTGYSPEVASGSVLDNGIDNSTYPVSALYSVGLNLSF
jgi:TonB-linked SusC/RagA family outer membrane protein